MRFPDIFSPMDIPDEITVSVLAKAKVIAVVGASPNPKCPSNAVTRYLIDQGFEVIPVRPKVSEILGRKCFASLEDIPVKVDIVDVFRKSEACPKIASASVVIGAKALWLQEGIVNEDAARIAREGGLSVVMDSCIQKIHKKMEKTERRP